IILQPLILSDDSATTTQVVLESQQEQEYKFEILSLSTASEKWVLHAKGKIKQCRDVIHNVSQQFPEKPDYPELMGQSTSVNCINYDWLVFYLRSGDVAVLRLYKPLNLIQKTTSLPAVLSD
ncbi:MAG: hypothetical protein AAF063_37630, partial [Cyanobacteria bacterium J06643_5]